MPIYIFRNPNNGELREVVQSMSEKHVYSEDGIEFVREFSVPTASVSSINNIDPFSSKNFAEVTGNKKGTYGDIIDLSKELSQKRADKIGTLDPVKEKYYQNYSKQRRGKKHPDVKKRELKKSLEKNKFISLSE